VIFFAGVFLRLYERSERRVVGVWVSLCACGRSSRRSRAWRDFFACVFLWLYERSERRVVGVWCLCVYEEEAQGDPGRGVISFVGCLCRYAQEAQCGAGRGVIF